jgi:hypothetical protein|tara:strand:+ start:322 stop:630 length:309 start_codon:yes stop_codon:yes gene_type:complete
MSNWADFAISAVKRGPGLGLISQVQVHEDRGKEFGPAVIVGKHEVASDIKRGKKYITIFRTTETDWEQGDYVRSYVKDGEAHIRTDDNKVDSDNLGTLPDIE